MSDCRYSPEMSEMRSDVRQALRELQKIVQKLHRDESLEHKLQLFLDSPNDLSEQSETMLRNILGASK